MKRCALPLVPCMTHGHAAIGAPGVTRHSRLPCPWCWGSPVVEIPVPYKIDASLWKVDNLCPAMPEVLSERWRSEFVSVGYEGAMAEDLVWKRTP